MNEKQVAECVYHQLMVIDGMLVSVLNSVNKELDIPNVIAVVESLSKCLEEVSIICEGLNTNDAGIIR